MRWVKWLAAIPAAVILVGVGGYIWGSALPREHEARGAIDVPAAPAAVYARITDVTHAGDWRPEVQSVEILRSKDNLRWREVTEFGPMVYEMVQTEEPTKVVTRVADPDGAFGGTWTIELRPIDTGTRLTIAERGWVENPLFRVLSKYVFGHETSIRGYQAALARSFERKPR